MNNAFLLEEFEEQKPQINEEEVARLTKLIEAIDGVLKTSDWATLEELHFLKEEERVERLLLSEAQKSPIDDKEIYRLQGEARWAKRYANFRKWAEFLKNQLKELKKHG